MTIIQAIILGIIQGLTEFIPVSSSGHIYTLPNLFGWNISGLDFSSFIAFIHIGTLASLLFFFRRKLWRYLEIVFIYIREKGRLNTKEGKDFAALRNIAISVIPAGILGLLLSDTIDAFYNSRSAKEAALLVAVPMIVVGFLFLIENRILKGTKHAHQIGTFSSIVIGFSQAIAFIRGVSRSGITLLSGQLMGLNRVSAAEFSFLMGVPIIGAAALKSIYDVLTENTLSQDNLIIYLAGALAAFIAGNFAIRFMLNYLQTKSLKFFGIYRLIFGAVLILSSIVA
jgi:undecaprenyl-diphosphatase